MAFQILSISGGGFLGLYTACVLAELEEQLDRPLASCFDLLAGTSVGGIIALGLSRGVRAATIRDAFKSRGPCIFTTHKPSRLDLLKNIFNAKYRSQELRSTVEELVGKETRIGDLQHRVMVPAVNLTKGSPQVFKTDHHQTFQRDWKLKVVDVALATSAAPTFFPLHKIGGELFADGGLYANSPDELALHEAEHFLDQKREDIAMLSVGTTTSKFSFSNSARTNLGWLGWITGQRLPRVMISSQQLNAEHVIRHRLQDRYLRLDRDQSPEQERFLALDYAGEGAISDLVALAEATIRDAVGKTRLPDFLQHRAAQPTFYNRKAG